MDTNTVLTFLQVVIGALGVLVVILAWVEYGKIRDLRVEVKAMLADMKESQRRAQKAQQRIIASYSVSDPARKIALIRSAISSDPDTFNGYSALGYALLECGDKSGALTAFIEATIRHPKAKEGWLDLAAIHVEMGNIKNAKEALWIAIDADASAHEDASHDSRLSTLLD